MSGFTNTERRKQGAMERHIQSIILFLILGILGWVGVTLLTLRDSSVELKTQISGVEGKIIELKSQYTALNGRFDSYPTRIEVQSRFDAEASKHEDMGRRIDALERRSRQ